MDHMINYKQLVKILPSKTIVLTVEDINLPTINNEILFKLGKKIASMHSAEHAVFVYNSKKDLLPEDKKIHYLNLLYPNINFINGENISEILESLSKKYSKIIITIDPNKKSKYKSLSEKYNVQFEFIEEKYNKSIISKLKSFASNGEYKLFKENLATTIREIDAKLLMNDVREHLGLPLIKEQISIDVDEIREQYFKGSIFKEGDIVESNNILYAIIKRGSNHLLLEDSDGNKISKWIKDVKPIEMDKEMIPEELTNKTIKPNDKIKVARMIADFLGLESAEKSSSPDTLVNTALRKVKGKIIHTDSISMLEKMLRLADEVGIKYDKSALPAKMKEACEPRVVEIDKKSKRNAAGDIMSYKDFKKSLQMNKESVDTDNLDDQEDLHIMNPDGTTSDIKHWDHRHTKVGSSLGADNNDHLRRMKVKYKTEEVDYQLEEDFSPSTKNYKVTLQHTHPDGKKEDYVYYVKNVKSDKHAAWTAMKKHEEKKISFKLITATKKELVEDVYSADYKINPETGRKYRAHRINFKNSGSGGKLSHDDEDEDPKIKESVETYEDIPEDELEKMANAIDHEDHILDLYEPDELVIVDGDSGEEIKEEVELDEEQLDEVLSRAERIKTRIRFMRTKSKRNRRLKIVLKRRSDTKTINRRARKLAIKTLKERLAKKKVSQMSVSEKERIERMIQQRKALVNRLAMRMVPRIRKIEQDRLSHNNVTKD